MVREGLEPLESLRVRQSRAIDTVSLGARSATKALCQGISHNIRVTNRDIRPTIALSYLINYDSTSYIHDPREGIRQAIVIPAIHIIDREVN